MTRFNNKVLLISLLILLGGFVVTRLFRSPGRERNLRTTLLTFDTAAIREIQITPPSNNHRAIKLVRSDSSWTTQQEQITSAVESTKLKRALTAIESLHPERLVSRNKEKWGDYKVDSTGTNVKVYTDNDTPMEFWVGQTTRGTSCVRLEGEDDVYEVKESLSSYYNTTFSAWRDKTFLRLQPDDITMISFTYAGDSSFRVTRENKQWVVNGTMADSTHVKSYLNKLQTKNIAEFADDFTPSTPPEYSVTFNDDKSNTITVNAWNSKEDNWMMTSSLREDVYFLSKEPSLFKDLFASRNTFLSK